MEKNVRLAPIILFVYNRPIHTRKTVEALQKNEYAKQSVLYIFADGPKIDADNATISKIQEIRQYIHSIQGFKEIIIKEQQSNIGLDTSITNGVSQVLDKHGRCITLEDDVITHPWFLHYMNECLDKYEDDKRVWQIGGFINNINFPWWFNKDVVLIPRCCSWGWGIWKDRWDKVDWHPKDVDDFKKNQPRKEKFCRGGNDLLPMFLSQMRMDVPAWDIVFQYTISNNNGYVVMPVKSLTFNIGCDGTGIHCGNIDMSRKFSPSPNGTNYSLVIPHRISTSSFIEQRYKDYQDNNDETLFHRIKMHIKNIVKKFL